MEVYNELSQISQITDNIYLSGIIPLDEDVDTLKKYNIKCILSCVERVYVTGVHSKVMVENPDIMILYLPYNDQIEQNLWTKNKNMVNISKYTNSMEEYNKLRLQLQHYNNKPMIEIGYHFIDHCIASNKNVLVHCMAGVSRSVSLVIYYIMKKYHVNYQEAYDLVKTRRHIANPNDSFKLQLERYQNKRDQFTEQDAHNTIIQIKYRKKYP